MLERLSADEQATLLALMAKAEDHHDDAQPTVTHDLPALASRPGLGSIATALLIGLISDRDLQKTIYDFVKSKIQRKPKAESVHNPATNTPTAPPKTFTEPEPPVAHGGAALPGETLEVWGEDAWHNWEETPENPGGQFNPNVLPAEGKALPPAPSIWYLAGVQPGPDGHARIPQNEPETVFPEAVHHFQWDDGPVHSFSSNHQIDGGTQPIPEIGHVQGGDKWQKSNGWGFILRVKGFHGTGPRMLKYWITAAGKTSNVVAFPISRDR